jgi:lipopolysaccharide assembly outer membrane protein LptD (OstA)
LELSGGYFDDDIDDIEYVDSSSEKWNLDLDSRLDITAIGPQVGIEGKYALGNKLVLKAGAKAGILFGTATSDATWSVDNWDYEEVEDSYKWVLDGFADVSYTATDSVQISTYDLSASLGYQITEQWSVEAGYYASLWRRVPSLRFFKYDPEETCPGDDPINYRCDSKKATWEQPEARDIIVSGITAGVNFKF